MNDDKPDHDEITSKATPRKIVGREELFDVFKSDGNAELFSKPTQRKNSTTQDSRSGPTIPHRMVDGHGPSISQSSLGSGSSSDSGHNLPHQISDATGPSIIHHLNDAQGPTIQHQINDVTGPSITHHLTDANGPMVHHQLIDATGVSTTHPIADAKGPITIHHSPPDAAGPSITHHWADANGPSIQHSMQDAVGPIVPRTLENVIVKPPVIQRLFSLFTVGKKTEPAPPKDNASPTGQTIHLDSTHIKMEDRIAKVMSAQKETLEKMKALEADSEEIGSTSHAQIKSKGH